METTLQWGLDVIRFVQLFASPPLTVFMRFISMLGAAPFYIILLPFIHWCIDEKKGLRLALAVLVSVWVNISLKHLFDQPRPFFEGYDPSVGMISERMGGFPSGHAQTALVMWAIIVSWGKKKWYRHAAAALLCVLIGFSRIYLGVHFPTDIFGGWLLGGIILCAYFFLADRIETLISASGPRTGLIACAALAFIMIMYRPSPEILMPGGMILGLGTGYGLCRLRIGFWASALSGRTGAAKYAIPLVRFLLGITVFVLLYVASGKALAAVNNSGNYRLFIFFRFALLAFWISAGAPWLFRFLRLADNA